MTLPQSNMEVDTSEAREYNRTKRWLEIGDLVLSFGLLIALLATGWTNSLRDLAVRMARDYYVLQLFFYVLFLSVISKVVGIGLDFYSFRLEHRFNLSTQKFGSWLGDELKRWLVGLLETAMARLRDEFSAAGKERQFQVLKVFLSREGDDESYEAAGAELNTSGKTIAVAVHRIRRRFRQVVRSAIADTVASAQDVEEEYRSLFA